MEVCEVTIRGIKYLNDTSKTMFLILLKEFLDEHLDEYELEFKRTEDS